MPLLSVKSGIPEMSLKGTFRILGAL
jgi:hypothetical protein